MPIYMDRHDMKDATPEMLAQAHVLDLSTQSKYGVEFLTYWFDRHTCTTFCLVDAPDAATAIQVHQEAHGELPSEIIEVEPSVVEAFLGRIRDPVSAVVHKAPIDESAVRAIMFTDIVGSTEMTARLGDEKAMEVVRAHDSLVRRALGLHVGREVKHIGDGIMAAFDQPRRAVECACEIQRSVGAFNGGASEPLYLRIGVHAGEPVQESNDLFGTTVQMASRICADAAVEAVVISELVREHLAEDFALTPLGRRVLKGFNEPVPLFSVEWREQRG